MHAIRFYPLGNADTCLFELSGGKLLLFDFANMRDQSDKKDKRIDLSVAIKERLEALKKHDFDVVAFTHADDDHIHGSSDFFYLEHAEKYQSKDRIKIKELWVPAAMIVEEGAEDEARILRAEARYRLKEGKGIRVFSRPELLKEWLANEGIDLKDRLPLITDAGTIVPGYSKENDEVEFFVHSPFAKHVEDEVQDRNESALIFHVTFSIENVGTRMLLIGDTTYEILKDIVVITKAKKREERLQYDIFDIPHHCSYKALSDKENKGKTGTTPDPDVGWLLEQGSTGCLLVSCSDVIPDKETDQPPHMQAANYYKKVASSKNGEFKVTMEHPSVDKPEPLVISIGKNGFTLEKKSNAPFVIASQQAAPRAGEK